MTIVPTGPFASRLTAAAEAVPLRAIAFQASAIMAAFAIPTAAALLLDDRQLNGVSVWHKPLKFEASIFVHMLTLGVLAALLTPAAAIMRRVRWAYQISAFSAVTEIAYIVLQAARGRASHFNFETRLEFIMYGLMGFGAVLLVACAFIIGYSILEAAAPQTGKGLRLGAAWGLMLGAIGTLLTAAVMSSGAIDGPGHWVGGIHSDANGLPLTGWSATGGDLRVPHFFATHMMQALPVLGFFADRYVPCQARRAVWAGAFVLCAMVVLTFVHAATGHPLLRL